MGYDIIKFNPLHTQDIDLIYKPAFTIIKKKIYMINNWQELFKLLMFSLCYNNNNMERVLADQDAKQSAFNNKTIIITDAEESEILVKFAPNHYIRTFNNTRNNCVLLNKVKEYCNTKDFAVYIIRANSSEEAESAFKDLPQYIESFRIDKRFRIGSTKHLIAHINGKVLSKKERFFRRIEKEFNRKCFIGDIALLDDEDVLKQFMHKCIERIISGGAIFHEKVFAYGLVQTAINHYKDKVFWPHINTDYNVRIKPNDHRKINEAFRGIMEKHNKAYEDEVSYIQNICMHAFVCNQCAGQFFDYMFDFWRIDLDESLENIIDDNGNNLFEIMIDEIDNNVQNVMIHTTMALNNNPSGCKNRFRRILKMIDASFWKGTQYNSTQNRITLLFNEWKNNPRGLFVKELKRRAEERKRGRGEKRLSKPTIVYDPVYSSFSLFLPKQILKDCTESEYPKWYVNIGNSSKCLDTELFRGKSSFFTKDISTEIDDNQIFDDFEIILKSEIRVYSRSVIIKEEYRFFNSKNRYIEIIGGYISKDARLLITRKGVELEYVNGEYTGKDMRHTQFDLKSLEPSDGEIIILPNKHAVPIGRPLKEGIIDKYSVSSVMAVFENEEYPILSKSEKLFLKTTKKKFNGTSLRFFNDNAPEKIIKLSNNHYLEFKLDESINETFGYIVDLSDYISKNGFYNLEINVPGRKSVSYKFCLINGFSFVFQNAPYIFAEYGKISFPKNVNIITDKNWIQTGESNDLVFMVDEETKNGNRYVEQRRLRLLYQLDDTPVEIRFDIPVLYWKFKENDTWSFRHPDDMFKNKMPDRIYLTGNLELSSAKLVMSDGFSDEYTDIATNYDKKFELYYFRSMDIRSMLGQDDEAKEADILVNGARRNLLKIFCKSQVRSCSISGDIEEGIIYGYFDILGASEYMVSIKKENKIIEENIPVVNGEFRLECDVSEGIYNITLYELEDNDSGFDEEYISIELKKISIKIVDVRNMSGKTLTIDYIQDRAKKYSKLDISRDYSITRLRKIDYIHVQEYDTYFWKYDNTDEYEHFTYYLGDFCVTNYHNELKKLCKVLVVFDNPQNAGEILINVIHENVGCSLCYDKERRRIEVNESKKLTLTVLDDDLYTIAVKIGR